MNRYRFEVNTVLCVFVIWGVYLSVISYPGEKQSCQEIFDEFYEPFELNVNRGGEITADTLEFNIYD